MLDRPRGVRGARRALGSWRADPAGTTRTVLLRARTPRRPHLWFEVLLIAASYWVYSMIRSVVPEQRGQAMRNADWLWELERRLGIAVESAVNKGVDSVNWLIVGMNYYYATLHFVVTIGVLAWLYRRHPGRYSATRLVLLVTTGSALVGYYLYPLAPPRLISRSMFVDTVVTHRTWGSLGSDSLKDVSNQYAAMPSMHVGWALWCGLTVFALSKVPWVRVLALVYPAITVVVIVATANHFWLDAVGGIICLACGYLVARWWYGAWPYALPRRVPRPGPSRRAAASVPVTAGSPRVRPTGCTNLETVELVRRAARRTRG
ncbi:inositol phosphorylceramide synthase [Streptomyces sulfonofaciens]|uniref:Inositol phosphorylceramide synthase n=2 Tax=Streptomyces sulfonofaciens TaxID=68272 RepID=A0A919FXZ8_9ACTN|nr:phosphatase PAP2 family protein [Streptomyces sulfonofaciens]GHH74587.1 inositol phosphorylceramide synthase [Streptomyces sulfonofaciens]